MVSAIVEGQGGQRFDPDYPFLHPLVSAQSYRSRCRSASAILLLYRQHSLPAQAQDCEYNDKHLHDKSSTVMTYSSRRSIGAARRHTKLKSASSSKRPTHSLSNRILSGRSGSGSLDSEIVAINTTAAWKVWKHPKPRLYHWNGPNSGLLCRAEWISSSARALSILLDRACCCWKGSGEPCMSTRR
jgi:hypothetical protein